MKTSPILKKWNKILCLQRTRYQHCIVSTSYSISPHGIKIFQRSYKRPWQKPNKRPYKISWSFWNWPTGEKFHLWSLHPNQRLCSCAGWLSSSGGCSRWLQTYLIHLISCMHHEIQLFRILKPPPCTSNKALVLDILRILLGFERCNILLNVQGVEGTCIFPPPFNLTS